VIAVLNYLRVRYHNETEVFRSFASPKPPSLLWSLMFLRNADSFVFRERVQLAYSTTSNKETGGIFLS